MSVKLLAEHNLEFLSLKGGCTGSSESTLVKMLHCRKSHVMAHVQTFAHLNEIMCREKIPITTDKGQGHSGRSNVTCKEFVYSQ